MMKPFSHQAVLLQAVWNDVLSHNSIIEKMIQQADMVLESELKNSLMLNSGKDLYDLEYMHDWSSFAYEHLFNDGAFYPFTEPETVRCAAYKDYMEEHGNEDDESYLLTCYWITALTDMDPMKYMPLIREFMFIQINGL